MCFDWFKKLRLFVNERNLKIEVFLKVSRAVVIRWFALNEARLGLFKFIFDYLPYFEKINIFFNIITKKVWINLKGLIEIIWNNLNQVISSSWAEQKLRSILKCLLICFREISNVKIVYFYCCPSSYSHYS